jgi:hypothetical protein
MLDILLAQIKTQPETVEFNSVISAINTSYDFTPTRFVNGVGEDTVINEAGANEGSCRVFAFAQLHQLTQAQTLHCFGDYYRKDVLGNTGGDDHANIRTFIRNGWAGIQFDHVALIAKH